MYQREKDSILIKSKEYNVVKYENTRTIPVAQFGQ